MEKTISLEVHVNTPEVLCICGKNTYFCLHKGQGFLIQEGECTY